MPVTARPTIRLGVIETFSLGAVQGAQVLHNGFGLESVNLDSTTTPPVTNVSSATYALISGAKTIDFTALAGLSGTQDMSGKKLQMMILENPAGNSAITIGKGVTNGYSLFGGTNTVTVHAHSSLKGVLSLSFPEGLPDVAAGAKTIDVSGSGTQSFNLTLVFG